MRTLGSSTLTKVPGWVGDSAWDPNPKVWLQVPTLEPTFLTSVHWALKGVTFGNACRTKLSWVLLSPFTEEETEAQKWQCAQERGRADAQKQDAKPFSLLHRLFVLCVRMGLLVRDSTSRWELDKSGGHRMNRQSVLEDREAVTLWHISRDPIN